MKEKLILASNNKKKLAELRMLLGDEYEVLSLAEAGICSEPEETGTTFEENSYIKALSAVKLSGRTAVADDSGLEVYALNGEPGVYSSRFAERNGTGKEGDDGANNSLLLEKMKSVTDRRAAFVSFITLLRPDGSKVTAEGRCEGIITDSPSGTGGFGYDPLFFLPELGKTMAELTAEEKNTVSHRGKALRELCRKLGKETDSI